MRYVTPPDGITKTLFWCMEMRYCAKKKMIRWKNRTPSQFSGFHLNHPPWSFTCPGIENRDRQTSILGFQVFSTKHTQTSHSLTDQCIRLYFNPTEESWKAKKPSHRVAIVPTQELGLAAVVSCKKILGNTKGACRDQMCWGIQPWRREREGDYSCSSRLCALHPSLCRSREVMQNLWNPAGPWLSGIFSFKAYESRSEMPIHTLARAALETLGSAKRATFLFYYVELCSLTCPKRSKGDPNTTVQFSCAEKSLLPCVSTPGGGSARCRSQTPPSFAGSSSPGPQVCNISNPATQSDMFNIMN